MTTVEGWPVGSYTQHPTSPGSRLPENLVGSANEANIVLDDINCLALLDTGSAVSTMCESFYKTLTGVPLEPLQEILNIEGAAGQKLPYLGYVSMSLQIPGMNSLKQQCLLLVTPDTKYSEQVPVLLGTNILCPVMEEYQQCYGVRYLQNANIESPWQLAFRCINKQNRQLQKMDGNLGVLKSAQLHNISVPSNSSKTISCFLDKDVGYHPCLALTQPLTEGSQSSGLEIMPVLLNYSPGSSTQIPVIVSNLSATTVNVQPNSVICGLQMCSIFEEHCQAHTEVNNRNCDKQKFLSEFDLSQTSLNSDQKSQVAEFLWNWRDVFSQHEDDIGFTNAIKHRIELSDPTPFKQRHRRIPPSMYEEVRQHLEHLLKANVIRKSHSPFASNIVLVRRKNGKLRMCLDFRQLNLNTIKDSYALPRIEELLDGLSGSLYFTVLDMKSAYLQVGIVEEHKERTAFTVGPLGFFEFERMPYGLCNAPATYQRLMADCLGNLNHNICQVYLDDVIITGSTFEEHLNRIGMVLQRFKEYGMKVSPSKCQLFKERVQYVGHVVSSDGVEVDPSKTEKILNWPTPKNVDELRSFLGLAGYYRRYIRNYAVIARPLNNLLLGQFPTARRKKQRKPGSLSGWNWGPEQDSAFQKLKTCLTSPPILAFPDFTKSFALYVDACTAGLGAVLYQHQNGLDRVIAYGSRSLTSAEKNYSVHRLEFLALKWAITQKFHDYLYGTEFVVYTDHNPLTYLLTTAKLDATGHRWLAALSNYNFKIKYKPGKSNVAADALSRLPSLISDDPDREEISVQSVGAICKSGSPLYIETLSMSENVCNIESEGTLLNYRDWRLAQRADPVIKQLMEQVISGDKKLSQEISQEWKKEFGKLVLKRGVLYRRTEHDGTEMFQLILPPDYREEALKGVHDNVGHLGRDRAITLLRDRFFWPKMGLDLAKRISNCQRCLRRKTCTKIRAPMETIETTQPLELVCMDFLSLETSLGGFKYILVITDHFTKYAQAVPTKDMTAKTTAEAFLKHFVQHYGFAYRIHSDQGANFEGKLIKELCKMTGMEKSRTTPFHPQCNGICERFNQTLLNMLGTLEPIQKTDWKSYVGPLVHAYNCTRHDTTGFSPYQLMFGRNPRLPIDVVFGLVDTEEEQSYTKYIQELKEKLKYSFELASESARMAQSKQKKYYDMKARAAVLEVGDRVLVKATYFEGKHKLADKWEEDPYIVVRQPNDNIPVYEVKKENGQGRMRTLHRNMLLPITSLPLTEKAVPRQNANLEHRSAASSSSDLQNYKSDESDSEEDIDFQIVSHFGEPEGQGHDQRQATGVDQATAAAPEGPAEAAAQRPDDPQVEALEQPLRRSSRRRKPPSWMEDGQYVMPQVSHSHGNVIPKPSNVTNSMNLGEKSNEKNSWSVTERINLLKILSSEGAFTGVPVHVAESIWNSIVT